MRLELGPGSYPIHYLFRDKVGLYTGNPVSFYAVHIVQGFQKVQKGLAGGSPEITGIDSGKDYFLYSLGCYFPGIFHTFAYRNVAAAASGVWYCTIFAEIVAPVLYFQKRTGPFSSAIGSEYAGNVRPRDCASVESLAYDKGFLFRSEYAGHAADALYLFPP